MAGIRILMVEDDWIIAKEISLSLQDMGFEVVGTFDTGEEALAQLPALHPDLVLVDIGLAGALDGIATADAIRRQHQLPFIFLTALADAPTVQQAKLTQPYAYLVKPVRPDALYSAIEITLHNAAHRKPLPQAEVESLDRPLAYTDSIFVKNRKRHQRLQLSDIYWVEAYDIYAQLGTAQGNFLISQSLKVVEEKLPTADFVRVHRSFLVNLHKIEAIEENDLILQGRHIPIGKTYREPLMRKLQFL